MIYLNYTKRPIAFYFLQFCSRCGSGSGDHDDSTAMSLTEAMATPACAGFMLEFCSACQQFFCGKCYAGPQQSVCPSCEAPFDKDEPREDLYHRLEIQLASRVSHPKKTVFNLIAALSLKQYFGDGTPKDKVRGLNGMVRISVEGSSIGLGYAAAMHFHGIGTKQNVPRSLNLIQLAIEAEQKQLIQQQQQHHAARSQVDGAEDSSSSPSPAPAAARTSHPKSGAIAALDCIQEGNMLSQPLIGTTVTVVCLTSAKGVKYNSKVGTIVEAPPPGTKRGRAAVQLDSIEMGATPISFQLKNLRIHPKRLPRAGSTVTIVYLSSDAGADYNMKKGKVVQQPPLQPPLAPGRVLVLLEGASKPMSFRFVNLYVSSEPDPTNPCPICITNEDDYSGSRSIDEYHLASEFRMCSACGQQFCSECARDLAANMAKEHANSRKAAAASPLSSSVCPTCRASWITGEEEGVERILHLVHKRAPGRHTGGAQYSLATFYDVGAHGIRKDAREAAKWWKRSADNGFMPAQYNLARAYLQVHGPVLPGIKQNFKEAARLYTLVADAGLREGQYKIAMMCLKGHDGVPQNYVQAARRFRQSAEGGHIEAMHELGNLLALTHIAICDFRSAKYWLERAVAAYKATEPAFKGAQIDLSQLNQFLELKRLQEAAGKQFGIKTSVSSVASGNGVATTFAYSKK